MGIRDRKSHLEQTPSARRRPCRRCALRGCRILGRSRTWVLRRRLLEQYDGLAIRELDQQERDCAEHVADVRHGAEFLHKHDHPVRPVHAELSSLRAGWTEGNPVISRWHISLRWRLQRIYQYYAQCLLHPPPPLLSLLFPMRS